MRWLDCIFEVLLKQVVQYTKQLKFMANAVGNH